MNTNFPTSTIYFIFAFTYCSVEVYDTELEFVRKILEFAGIELTDLSSSQSFQKVDTRIILHLVAKAMPGILDSVIPDKRVTIQNASLTLFLPKS